jgi:aminoglycoside phosphotransferase (APT) family kinase protein
MSTLGDPMVEVGWFCGCIETLGASINQLPAAEIARARRDFLSMYEEITGRVMDGDKIKFGEVFYNYQLCSVTVSADWMRRQRGEPPLAEPSGENFRDEIGRLIGY